MSKVWLAQAIALVILGGLWLRWWLEYRRHARTDAPSPVQGLRGWRVVGLGLVLLWLLIELVTGDVPLGWQILLAVGTVGFGGCIVIVTWLALAANRRYPGALPEVDALGTGRERGRDRR